MIKSYVANENDVERKWLLVDATDKPTGRLAVEIAAILRGKNKPTYTPHVDTGDFVVVVNADKVKLTGTKEEKKIYKHYTGYPSGLREFPAKVIREKLEETERRLEELRAFRESLLEYRERAAGADARGACRCADRGESEFCGCVAAATDGVTAPDLRVVRENDRFVRKVEAGKCRCGCCEPVYSGVV